MILLASLGDRFNTMIDNLLAAGWRMLELPLIFLLPFALIIAVACFKVLIRVVFRNHISRDQRLFFFSVFTVVWLLLLVDLKHHRNIELSRHQTSPEMKVQATPFDQVRLSDYIQIIKRDSGWFSVVQQQAEENQITIEEALVKNAYYVYQQEQKKMLSAGNTKGSLDSALVIYFDGAEVNTYLIDKAAIVYTVKNPDKQVACNLAIIDLNDPNLQIEITPELSKKWLTSDFAKKNDCYIAINGEAGESPQPDCGLGRWVGNWIVKGRPVMMKDNDKRPFIAFNAEKKASYSTEKAIDLKVGDKFNCIWGRFDILLEEQNLNREPGWGQPRTAMGINETGDKLYLLVVDGRQPGHSMGLGLKECADVMKLAGAANAMSCDQGGSSCMYVRDLGGIINRPSDGFERPVYVHFGIKRVE